MPHFAIGHIEVLGRLGPGPDPFRPAPSAGSGLRRRGAPHCPRRETEILGRGRGPLRICLRPLPCPAVRYRASVTPELPPLPSSGPEAVAASYLVALGDHQAKVRFFQLLCVPWGRQPVPWKSCHTPVPRGALPGSKCRDLTAFPFFRQRCCSRPGGEGSFPSLLSPLFSCQYPPLACPLPLLPNGFGPLCMNGCAGLFDGGGGVGEIPEGGP